MQKAMEAVRQYSAIPVELEDKPARQRVYYKPDADFYRSITIDELLVGIHRDIDRMFDKFERKKCG